MTPTSAWSDRALPLLTLYQTRHSRQLQVSCGIRMQLYLQLSAQHLGKGLFLLVQCMQVNADVLIVWMTQQSWPFSYKNAGNCKEPS